VKYNVKIKTVTLPNNLDPDQYILQKKDIKMSFLKEKSKDFIFYNVEEWKKKNYTNKEIEKKLVSLLQYYDQENKRYYTKELYKIYQISLNLAKYSYDKEKNLLNDKKGYYLLSQTANDSDKLIHINKLKKKQYNETERNIIIEILLSDKFLQLIFEERYIVFWNNSSIISIIEKIKEYYEKYLPEENISNNRHVNLERFTLIYEDFFKKNKSKFDFDILKEDITNSFFFKYKKSKKHLEDLKKLLSKKKQIDEFTILEEEINSLEKELTKMITNEEHETIIEEKGKELIKKKIKLHKMREKLAKL
jgi:hypothetical protein